MRPSPRYYRRLAVGAVLASALAGCGGDDNDRNISEVVVFGDSLSDLGTYNPTTADDDPGNDRDRGLTFTTKPGSLWVQQVAAEYRLAVGPNRLVNFGVVGEAGEIIQLGGSGYAEGAAQVADDDPDAGITEVEVNGQTVPVQGVTRRSVKSQIDAYLDARDGFAGDQLVLIQGGANDFLSFFEAAEDSDDLNATPTVIEDTATAMVTQIERLIDAGAENVVYANLPDLGDVPLVENIGVPGLTDLATQASSEYNEAVADGLADTDVVIYDLFGLFRDAIARPRQYGLVDVENPACGPDQGEVGFSVLLCGPNDLVSPNADQTYLFADSLHPTTGVHRFWGESVAEVAQARIEL